jgi:hypothetical protein
VRPVWAVLLAFVPAVAFVVGTLLHSLLILPGLVE